MRADEKPDNLVIVPHAHGAIRIGHAYGPEWQARMQTLELKTGMRRVRSKATISRSGPLLNVTWQLGEITSK
jgi:hypothetical protein